MRFVGVQLNVQPNLQVLSFSAGLCFLSGILFGLAPALRATRADLTSALKQNTAGLGVSRLDRLLVTAQVALPLLLLVGATLLVRSLQNLKNLDAGFSREHVLLVGQDLSHSGYEGRRVAEFYNGLLAKTEAMPMVRSATVVQDTPLSEPSWFGGISIPGYTPPSDVPNVFVNHVGPRFFETFGIAILAGREFDSRDNEIAPKVIAINQAMARRYFGDDNSIGRPTSLGTIVAVVKDARYDSLRARIRPVVYRPFLQVPES